jgi:hypothetical protein
MADDSADHYRALAEEAYAVARQMSDPQAQHIMCRIAEGYEHLALVIEGRQQSPAPTFISNLFKK